MDSRAVFGINVLMSLLSSIVIAKLYVWPRLRNKDRDLALTILVAPHMFLRFIGLSFIVPGVVSAMLPSAFAIPAAWGDFVAGLLAILATVSLAQRKIWAIPITWIFNLWGAADLLFAFLQGARVQLEPGMLGAAFFIVTAIVPLLLVTHALIFLVLAFPREATRTSSLSTNAFKLDNALSHSAETNGEKRAGALVNNRGTR